MRTFGMLKAKEDQDVRWLMVLFAVRTAVLGDTEKRLSLLEGVRRRRAVEYNGGHQNGDGSNR